MFLLLYVDDYSLLRSIGNEVNKVAEEIAKSCKVRIEPKVTIFLGLV